MRNLEQQSGMWAPDQQQQQLQQHCLGTCYKWKWTKHHPSPVEAVVMTHSVTFKRQYTPKFENQ